MSLTAYSQSVLVDDFEIGTSSWSEFVGASSIEEEFQNHYLRVEGDTDAVVLHNTFQQGEGVYEVEFRTLDLYGWNDTDMRFYFQVVDIHNHYIVVAMPEDSDNPQLVLAKVIDGTTVILAQLLPAVTEYDVWYDLKVVRSFCDGQINVFVNDSLYITSYDSDIMIPGTIGLGSWRSASDFDNVRFSNLPTRVSPELSTTEPRFLCPGDSAKVWCNYDCDSIVWFDGTTDDTLIVNGLSEMVYLTAYLGACPVMSDTIVFEQIISPVSVLVGDTIVCAGDSLKLFPTNYNSSYTYSWVGYQASDTLDVLMVQSNKFILMTSSLGCPSDAYDTISVSVVDDLIFGLNLPCSLFKGQDIQFEPYLNENEDYARINWDFGSGSISSEYSPIYRYDNCGEFYLMLFVETVDGCRDSLSAQLTVREQSKLGKVITENNDGINDRILFIGNNNSSNISIYNRWGQVVWSSIGVYKSFEGYNGKGVALPSGIYFYEHYCSSVDPLINLKPDAGYITILR